MDLIIFSDFGNFWCCWLARSDPRKHVTSRFRLSTTAVWRTPRRHTPHQESPSISRAVVGCGELWLPAGEVRTFSWGSFFVSFFVYPKFRLLQCLKVEVWTSAENQRETDLRRLGASEGNRSGDTRSICG